MSLSTAFAQTPTPTPQSSAQAQAAEIRMSLREREGTLSAEIARMEAQRPVMEKQIRDAGDGPFAMVYQQGLAQLDVQLAGARAELGAVRELAKMAVPDERPVTYTSQPPLLPNDPSFLGKIDSNGLVAAFVLLSVGFVASLVARFFRRRQVPPPSVAPEIVMARLDRVDQALDAIAIEVERVAESQRFMARMMAENAVKPVEAQPHQGLDEAKPLRALGAGPIEPIRVGDRQAVKASITPH